MQSEGSLKVYNSLSGSIEEFEPRIAGEVCMYVCGVTVYDECHVGHARAYVTFDVVRRYLEHLGFKVTYIQNFTDIDDKIINRAREQEKEFSEISSENTERYFDVMDRLNIKRADFYPTVSGHVAEIIKFVEGLIEKGYGYEVDGDVYFAVEKFDDYGRLSGQNIEEMREGSRIEVDERKKSPLDFALWKSSKEDEPGWDSPWGSGRPGWHIECSVMSQCHLGETLDIHGGGRDLIFPHHENERAQSEAQTGRPLARYWMHNGFVTIDEDKMSKSTGNFFTLREVYEKYDPAVVRYFILSRHYRSPIDFSFDRLKEAREALSGLRNLYGRLRTAESWPGGGEQTGKEAPDINSYSEDFEEAMLNDFNSAAALGVLQKWSGQWNGTLAEWEKKDVLHRNQQKSISEARSWLETTLENILGIQLQTAEVSGSGKDSELIEILISLRNQAREDKDYELSDKIRDRLLDAGVEIKDTPRGTQWEWINA